MKVFGDKDKILIEAEKGEKLALLEMDGAIQVESVITQEPEKAEQILAWQDIKS